MELKNLKAKHDYLNYDTKISQIGEQELLNRLKKFMKPGQIEDDTAEINGNNKKLLINTDVLIQNVHFSEITTSPEDIGWKGIAINVSDLILVTLAKSTLTWLAMDELPPLPTI